MNRLISVLALSTLAMVGTAHAASSRYALLIGANNGNSGDRPLRFAGEDAKRIASVLTEAGGFLAENVVVLADPDADRVRSALARLNARIRDEQGMNGDALLVVFYSGHADALSLHLGGTELPWDDLRNMTSGSPAKARILVVDACRSGAATRVKGMTLDTPFALPTGDTPVAEGFAVLSSATLGEDAQESDDLGGSFFSHHLASALRGVADINGDGRVTLDEAYRYAADRTIASSASTLAGVQHPTYAYDIKGKGDLVLTEQPPLSGLATLILGEPGQYYLHRDNEGGMLALEANVGKEPRQAWLRPGRYFVRRRLPDRLYEGKIELTAQATEALDTTGFRTVEYAQLVRKGGGGGRPVFALAVLGGFSGPIVRDYTLSGLGDLVFSTELSSLTVDAQVGAALGSTKAQQISGRIIDLRLATGARKVFDFNWVSVSVGMRGGLSYLWQTFHSDRTAPDRRQLIPSLSPLARVDLCLPWGIFATLEGGLRISYLHVKTGINHSQVQAPVQPEAAIGVGKHF